jgi:hypothetical protein
MSNWWIEYKSSRQGRYFTGTYQQAVEHAYGMCITDSTVVWVYNGDNRRVAQVTLRGVERTYPAIQGSSCPE